MKERKRRRPPRLMMVQYTDPAGYPPLRHVAGRQAGRGWEVELLALRVPGVEPMRWAPIPGCKARFSPVQPESTAASFLCYLVWCAWRALLWRPDVVYASDLKSAAPALIAAAIGGARIVYHEHDSPDDGARVVAQPLRLAYRRLARRADLAILPQEARLRRFTAASGRVRPSLCVWNCPAAAEVGPPRRSGSVGLRLHYHGSINPARLPDLLLQAMAAGPASTRLTFAGYETVGAPGAIEHVLRCAAELGLADRVVYLGVLERTDLLKHVRDVDLGLALVSTSGDVNMAHLAGASNKAFDYLSQGAAALVPDAADWRKLFVQPGYGMACNPADLASLTEALAWAAANRETLREMGEAGRRQIAEAWNYDRLFAPAAAAMDVMLS